jgi:hypothetical protein
MNHDNDDQPIRATDFPDTQKSLATNRSSNTGDAPCTWCKREKDEATFFGLQLWRNLNEPPRVAVNDNNLKDQEAEAGEQPVLSNLAGC